MTEITSWGSIPFGGTPLWNRQPVFPAAGPPLFLRTHPRAVFLKTGTHLTPTSGEKTSPRFASWPEYKLPDEEVWPLHGALSYHAIFQLVLLCQNASKWVGVPYMPSRHCPQTPTSTKTVEWVLLAFLAPDQLLPPSLSGGEDHPLQTSPPVPQAKTDKGEQTD